MKFAEVHDLSESAEAKMWRGKVLSPLSISRLGGNPLKVGSVWGAIPPTEEALPPQESRSRSRSPSKGASGPEAAQLPPGESPGLTWGRSKKIKKKKYRAEVESLKALKKKKGVC